MRFCGSCKAAEETVRSISGEMPTTALSCGGGWPAIFASVFEDEICAHRIPNQGDRFHLLDLDEPGDDCGDIFGSARVIDGR